MAKKLLALVLVLSMLLGTVNVFAVVGTRPYSPGIWEYDQGLSEPVEIQRASASVAELEMEGNGVATYDFTLPFDAAKMTVTYTAKSSGTVTVITDRNEYSFEISKGSNTAEVSLAPERMGAFRITFKTTVSVTITDILYTKIQESGENWISHLTILDYKDPCMEALRSSVVFPVNSNTINVKNALRRVDMENPLITNVTVDGVLYSPFTAFAHAFGMYMENYPELNYAYMSGETFAWYFKGGESWYEQNAKRVNMKNSPMYMNNVLYVPVRELAEAMGHTVEYRDGFAVVGMRTEVRKGVQRNIKLCIQGTTSSAETLRMNPDGSLMALNGSSIGSDAFTQPKKDDNGYFDIKINFYYGDFKGTEAWIAEFLDMNSNGQKFYGLYYAPTTFPHGLGGLGFGFYREKVDRDADTYVALTVKDLKIAQGGRRVFAISNDGEGAQPDADSVTLIYDDTLPTDTFKEGNVKLLDGTTEIPITYEGDTVSRKLIVKPAEYLEYGKTYTIKVSAGDIVNTNFTTAKRPVTVTNAVLADGLVTVTLENVAEGESNVILGMFDAEGKVVGFKITPAAESVNFENIPENVTTIKVYATEKLDGYTRKACETVTYTIEDEA